MKTNDIVVTDREDFLTTSDALSLSLVLFDGTVQCTQWLNGMNYKTYAMEFMWLAQFDKCFQDSRQRKKVLKPLHRR